MTIGDTPLQEWSLLDLLFGSAVAQQPPQFADPRRLPETSNDPQARLRALTEAQRRAAEEAEARRNAEMEARQRAEEEHRLRLEAQAAAFEAKKLAREAEQRRIESEAAIEAARRQAEAAEGRRVAAEAAAEAARREAEQAAVGEAEEERRKRIAAEAAALAAQQRAEAAEKQRLVLEAERERLSAVAEEALARERATAEARRQAEEEARQRAKEDIARQQADEAERRRAEERSRAAAAEEAAQRERAREQAAAAAVERRAALDAQRRLSCDEPGAAQVQSSALSGGRMQLRLLSPCRPGQPVLVLYGSFAFQAELDQQGRLDYILDLFLGTDQPASVRFSEKLALPLKLEAIGLDQVSKVAITWSEPVNIDLHALEYMTRRDTPGHVWAGQPRDFDTATTLVARSKRGRGFMSTVSDGVRPGDHLEVYTFLHDPAQRNGTVALMVDYESRGDTPSGDRCGDGRHAAVGFVMHRLVHGRPKPAERLAFATVACGVNLAPNERFNPYLIDDLNVRR